MDLFNLEPINKSNIYTNSGIHTRHFVNANGCDSLAVLDLSINDSSSSVEYISSCFEYYWEGDSILHKNSGTFSSTLTNAQGCDSLATIHLTIFRVDTTVTVNNHALTSNATGAVYQWVDCNTAWLPVPGNGNGQTYIPTADGLYAVVVAQNSCIDTSACYEIKGVGFFENSFDPALSFYPNPNRGELTIDFGNVYKQVDITISNAQGQMVSTTSLEEVTKTSLEIPGPSGVYFIDVSNNLDRKARLSIIKE